MLEEYLKTFNKFTLESIPVSINRYYIKGRILSEKGREFKESVEKELTLKKLKLKIDYPIEVFVFYYCCDRKGRDGDNILKSLQDSLEKGGFIVNDKLIKGVMSKVIEPKINYNKSKNYKKGKIKPYLEIYYKKTEEVFDERFV